MNQIEIKFYNLDEISEITGIKRNSKNLCRDVKNVLTNWGYGFDWLNRRGATITYIPTTAEERLQELLVRNYHVDIQVDLFDFSCYIYTFRHVKEFESMPWKEREDIFRLKYGKRVDEKTLRKWCSKLLDHNIIIKDKEGSYWKTEIIDNRKFRSPASEEQVKEYNRRRAQLLRELAADLRADDPKITEQDSIKEAWKNVYTVLWAEFHCCYYSCKTFYFPPWDQRQADVTELFELVDEVLLEKGYIING